jgi:hypothetical protein
MMVLLLGCDGAMPASDAGMPAAAPIVRYDEGALWSAPWPDERLREADGTFAIADFPNPRGIEIVDEVKRIIDEADGVSLSSTLFFPLTAPIDPSSLPSVSESLEDGASVFLVDVDAESPERGALQPIVVAFAPEPRGPFSTRNVLGLYPLQGRPLHPRRRYAAVVTTRVRGADGAPLEIAPQTAAIVRGEQPAGLSDAAYAVHGEAMDTLAELGVDTSQIAATAVFETWDPADDLARAREQVIASPPNIEGAFEAREELPDFCVFHATVRMPVLQDGTPPYETSGGGWIEGADGAFVVQREEEANVWVTLPRAAMPASGFPTVVFVRTGGGGDRPLIDRGHRSTDGGEPDEPGTGPAVNIARAGWAGVSVDGPLGGLRNLEGWDEQFRMFNVLNPRALRDNVRQSALELALFAHVVPEITIDASSCEGLTTSAGDSIVRLDGALLAIMGHSMGATIAPLVAAVEPAYRAVILSGAGGSYIENVMFKERPIPVRPNVELLLGYTAVQEIIPHDPALGIFQWAVESADTQVYARHVVDEPRIGTARHVLMFQGILDTYIPPPVANALSLAFAVDLGGDGLDETLVAEHPEYGPLTPLLPLAGAQAVALPASANREGVTALVAQHFEDGIEDGHEVMFQTPEPQLQYRCFLESLRTTGVPRVPRREATACE